MLWNEAERIVRRQKFGGYSHAIVAYTLSLLYHNTGMCIDLSKIWLEQKVGAPVKEAIEVLCRDVNNHIRDTGLNVTEWCKKEACWQKLKDRSLPTLPDMQSYYISTGGVHSQQIFDNNVVEFCRSKGASGWKELSKWLKDRGFMSGKARSQCFNMGKYLQQGREPSFILSKACHNIWETAENSFGWRPENQP